MSETATESSWEWWAGHRRRYNRGLIVAGLVAFAAYLAVGELCLTRLNGFEVTILSTASQAFGYLVAMAIANIFYLLGPLTERLVRPSDPAAFRRRTFRAGYWFSVALPFAIPGGLAYVCLL